MSGTHTPGPLAHTPGPWRAGYWSGRCHIQHRHDGTSCVYVDEFHPMGEDGSFVGIAAAEPGVSVVSLSYDELKIRVADAVLMAAAPELLAALKEARDRIHVEGCGVDGLHRMLCVRLTAAIDKAEGR